MTQTVPSLVAALLVLLPACMSSGRPLPQELERPPQARRITLPEPDKAFGSSRVMIGYQSIDDFDPISEALSFGIESAFESPESWIGGEGGFLIWQTDETEYYAPAPATDGQHYERVRFAELYGGVHKTFFTSSPIQPYFGAGMSVAYSGHHTHLRVDYPAPTGRVRSTETDAYFTLGVYAHCGISVQISKLVQVGVDVRELVGTDIGIFTDSADIDSTRVALFVGFGG